MSAVKGGSAVTAANAPKVAAPAIEAVSSSTSSSSSSSCLSRRTVEAVPSTATITKSAEDPTEPPVKYREHALSALKYSGSKVDVTNVDVELGSVGEVPCPGILNIDAKTSYNIRGTVAIHRYWLLYFFLRLMGFLAPKQPCLRYLHPAFIFLLLIVGAVFWERLLLALNPAGTLAYVGIGLNIMALANWMFLKMYIRAGKLEVVLHRVSNLADPPQRIIRRVNIAMVILVIVCLVSTACAEFLVLLNKDAYKLPIDTPANLIVLEVFVGLTTPLWIGSLGMFFVIFGAICYVHTREIKEFCGLCLSSKYPITVSTAVRFCMMLEEEIESINSIFGHAMGPYIGILGIAELVLLVSGASQVGLTLVFIIIVGFMVLFALMVLMLLLPAAIFNLSVASLKSTANKAMRIAAAPRHDDDAPPELPAPMGGEIWTKEDFVYYMTFLDSLQIALQLYGSPINFTVISQLASGFITFAIFFLKLGN